MLTREALINNQPDPSLYAHTVSATFGEVDAFMSHSWSDDGTIKYDKLNEWASELGGSDEKLIWLDKARARIARAPCTLTLTMPPPRPCNTHRRRVSTN